ncbi:MAG: LCP family protein [Actinomycetota bacterium]|nr:LCP family protein [Actinomycetota bacterium]
MEERTSNPTATAAPRPAEVHARPAEPRERTNPPDNLVQRWFLVTAVILGVFITSASAVGIVGIREVEEDVTTIAVDEECTNENCLKSVKPECIEKACTFLVLGSDSRAGLSREEQAAFGSEDTVTGKRTDTIILVQTDPRRDRTVVLSIPRDLRVEIPGHGVGKINSSFEWGPDVVVQTVTRLTGLRINHYVEVNLAGFERVVDALGGVSICIDRPMVDKLAGLRLTRAGCHRLDGQQALAFVRARHIEGDEIPDLSRIARQQQFMRAVIDKTLAAGSLFRLPSLVRAIQKNIVLDENLNLYKLQDLARKLAELGQGRVHFRIVPSVPAEIGGVSYLEVLPRQANALFHRLREGAALGVIGRAAPGTAVSPANVRIRVLDAGPPGRASVVATYLRRAGFVVVSVERAPPRFTRTEVLWDAPNHEERKVVEAYLSALPLREVRRQRAGADVTVVIGPEFRGVEAP